MLRLLYSALQHAAAQAHRAHAPPGTRAASSTGTHLPKCELILPTLQTLTLQLHNYQTIAAFAGGYWILWLLFRRPDAQARRAHATPGTGAASSTGTHLPKCELILPTLQTLTLQLHNYQTIAAFAGGYWILWLLFRRADARVFWSFTLTLLAAAGLEVAEV